MEDTTNWKSIAAKFQQRVAEMAAEYETKLIFQQEQHEVELAKAGVNVVSEEA